jgi:hypothetical protein
MCLFGTTFSAILFPSNWSNLHRYRKYNISCIRHHGSMFSSRADVGVPGVAGTEHIQLTLPKLLHAYDPVTTLDSAAGADGRSVPMSLIVSKTVWIMFSIGSPGRIRHGRHDVSDA